jgi:hypothetical protein
VDTVNYILALFLSSDNGLHNLAAQYLLHGLCICERHILGGLVNLAERLQRLGSAEFRIGHGLDGVGTGLGGLGGGLLCRCL